MYLVMIDDLFADQECGLPKTETLAAGAMLLRGFAKEAATEILDAVQEILGAAPFQHMKTPSGHSMSVGMTNCGSYGWVTDSKGYRYSSVDPESGKSWSGMPESFLKLAGDAAREAGFPAFIPDACLINRYVPGAKMSLHQDKDELDLLAPIVSVSLGLPATFLFGGMKRSDPAQRIALTHGDVVVWGGPARLFYHGVSPVKVGLHPATGGCRINLTFRKAK
jgi:alkylated DNA repair protein (DNA oxidative demethylase)